MKKENEIFQAGFNAGLKERTSEYRSTDEFKGLYMQADARATRLEALLVDARIELDNAKECLFDIVTKMPLDYLEYYYSNSSQQKEEWAKIIMKAKTFFPKK